MTDITASSLPVAAPPARRDIGLKKRYAAEARFRMYGIAAITFGLVFLAIMLGTIISKGHTAFWQTTVTLPVTFDPTLIDPQNKRESDPSVLIKANYDKLAQQALISKLGIDAKSKPEVAKLKGFLSDSARIQLRDMLVANPALMGQTVTVPILASANIDSAFKGQVDLTVPEARRKVKDQQITWMNQLAAEGTLAEKFNTGLFTYGASSRPETSGVGVAIVGSLYMMAIVLVLALLVGVAASIYLEEFAAKNRLTDLIEVNINNLAAVPSIVFGLLGLAVFINFLGMPRSAAIVGGITLSLMTLPTIIIATRAALAAVPPSIRQAALGLGASKMQMVFHHVLPLAMPGILTGTIIGLARALGETAPLLLIGMVAFVANYPATPFDPATALPVQIYMWANEAERAFVERMSGAIIILLVFLMAMNLTAIVLRRKFERRW
ncbi:MULTISPECIES: phosphate ABC transporter permease PstA [Mesorhizobium]|uniref:Phosphate transport system permease protein PstA n=1 Tax=Mesorhizobium denitrificans TaxID=2294114 RepID=A0A371XF77_9HYPH|nr:MULTISPECIES: phosphate ABC transporter permease PstA [Mesorhizobium]RFC67872.1 phosphate ABC transporter permease PstA [Mesorhizobium denitrificans]